MNWSNVIDIETFNDAYLTFINNYKKIRLDLFYSKTLKGKYFDVSLNKFKKMNVDNFDYDRLKFNDLKSIYPINDRPRGINDIKSVKYHLNTKNSISPIVLVKYKNAIILLDGVHRIIASHIMSSKIRILLIDLD